jgi:hypothetical protein
MSEPRVRGRTRRHVAERARYLCEYCRSPEEVSLQSFAVEHIGPGSGKHGASLDNLAYACQGCNNHKYTRTEGVDPVTDEVTPLFNPRQDRWSEQFAWSADSLRLIGLSPIGRATIEALHLNRAPVVNLRRMLHALGKHPPPERG